MTKSLTFLARVLAILLLIVVTAQAGTMKLLTSETGWTLMGPGLMWTTDGGNTWTNITPPVPKGEHITSVFFLDTQDGWALLSGPITGSEAPRLDLAMTVDSGQTWSVSPVDFPAPPAGSDLYGAVDMYFLDLSHGWVDMSLVSSAAARLGALLVTADGGRTWSWANSPGKPGRAGDILFITTTDGWLSGGPEGKLYVTHDGANTWQEVTFQPPPQAGRAIYPTYGLPEFENGQDGFLPVTFSGTAGVRSVLAMFATSDGGKTWIPDAVVPTLTETSQGQRLPTSIVNSTLITGNASDQTLTLTKATHGGAAAASAGIKLRQAAVAELSFVDSMKGWAVLGYHGAMHKLLATSDGGDTWTDITPQAPKRPLPRGKVLRIPRLPGPRTGPALPSTMPSTTPSQAPTTSSTFAGSESLMSATPEAPAAGGKANFHTSIHIGFDTSYVMSATPNMSTWWTYSPYYDTNVYLPGSKNRGTDNNLTSRWITSVEGQGWGLIPTWFGLQPPCTSFANTFSSGSDGTTEATEAESAATSLGLPKGIVIYKDIENFNTNDTGCGNIVKAYIGAWVTQLHKDGYLAGVYANPAPAEYWISAASPLPDAIWVGKGDGRATTWGLGALDDTKWPTDQRIHQFDVGAGTGVTDQWGGYSHNIDRDIEDAPSAGSNGSKNYNNFIFTDWGSDYNEGINDVVDSSGNLTYTFTGQYAGTLCPSYDQCNGYLYDPNTGGWIISYSGFDYALGVNNQDEVVGWTRDASGGYHGLICVGVGSSSCTADDYPGTTTGTEFKGVNDDGQIVGYWGSGAFVREPDGTYTDITQQGDAVAWGINGQGQVVGN